MSKYKLLSPTRKIKPCRNHTQQNPITIMPHTDFLLNLKSAVSFLLRQEVLCIDRLPWFRKMKKALHAFLMKHACTLHEHILIQIWSRCFPWLLQQNKLISGHHAGVVENRLWKPFISFLESLSEETHLSWENLLRGKTSSQSACCFVDHFSNATKTESRYCKLLYKLILKSRDRITISPHERQEKNNIWRIFLFGYTKKWPQFSSIHITLNSRSQV